MASGETIVVHSEQKAFYDKAVSIFFGTEKADILRILNTKDVVLKVPDNIADTVLVRILIRGHLFAMSTFKVGSVAKVAMHTRVFQYKNNSVKLIDNAAIDIGERSQWTGQAKGSLLLNYSITDRNEKPLDSGTAVFRVERSEVFGAPDNSATISLQQDTIALFLPRQLPPILDTLLVTFYKQTLMQDSLTEGKTDSLKINKVMLINK